jgi:hypothetical protein
MDEVVRTVRNRSVLLGDQVVPEKQSSVLTTVYNMSRAPEWSIPKRFRASSGSWHSERSPAWRPASRQQPIDRARRHLDSSRSRGMGSMCNVLAGL